MVTFSMDLILRSKSQQKSKKTNENHFVEEEEKIVSVAEVISHS